MIIDNAGLATPFPTSGFLPPQEWSVCERGNQSRTTRAKGELCGSRMQALLNVILSAAKNPKGFIEGIAALLAEASDSSLRGVYPRIKYGAGSERSRRAPFRMTVGAPFPRQRRVIRGSPKAGVYPNLHQDPGERRNHPCEGRGPSLSRLRASWYAYA